jgi:hypothetical protein
MMEAVRTSETSVDNYFTRQYIPEDNSELRLVLFLQWAVGHIKPSLLACDKQWDLWTVISIGAQTLDLILKWTLKQEVSDEHGKH